MEPPSQVHAPPPVLSHYQVAPLLEARRAGQTQAVTSLDLGRSTLTVTLSEQGVIFPDGTLLRWQDAATIAATPNVCFALRDGAWEPIRIFSATTGWVRSLYPTAGAPTTLVAGFAMHRIKAIDPWEDTRRKVRALGPVVGRVLDTATGLGYTAILAARSAQEVVTVERDPAAIELARLNPWSRELFDQARIRLIIGDVSEVIQEFADASFSRVIHDPPAFALAGELYSGAFYRQLYRVLKTGGRLFHYLGDLESAATRTLLPGVQRRLREAGFTRIVRRPEAFGLLCFK